MVNQHGDEKKIRTSVMLAPENRIIVERMAEEQERSMGYVIDKLVGEALRARGLLGETGGQE